MKFIEKLLNKDIKGERENNVLLKKQRGASLVEVVAYLGIAGLIIGGALAMFTGASASQSSNQMGVEINGIRTATRSLYSATGNYGTVNMLPTLSQSTQLPSTWIVAGTGSAMTAIHELNAGVGIIGATALFNITLDGIPAAQCVSIVSKQGNQGWSAIYVAAATATVAALATGQVTAFDPDSVATSCAATNNKITFASR